MEKEINKEKNKEEYLFKLLVNLVKGGNIREFKDLVNQNLPLLKNKEVFLENLTSYLFERKYINENLIFCLIKNKFISTNRKFENGETLLEVAAKENYKNLFKYLLPLSKEKLNSPVVIRYKNKLALNVLSETYKKTEKDLNSSKKTSAIEFLFDVASKEYYFTTRNIIKNIDIKEHAKLFGGKALEGFVNKSCNTEEEMETARNTLFKIVSEKYYNTVRFLVEIAHMDINTVFSYGDIKEKALIHIALETGNKDLFTYLLEQPKIELNKLTKTEHSGIIDSFNIIIDNINKHIKEKNEEELIKNIDFLNKIYQKIDYKNKESSSSEILININWTGLKQFFSENEYTKYKDILDTAFSIREKTVYRALSNSIKNKSFNEIARDFTLAHKYGIKIDFKKVPESGNIIFALSDKKSLDLTQLVYMLINDKEQKEYYKNVFKGNSIDIESDNQSTKRIFVNSVLVYLNQNGYQDYLKHLLKQKDIIKFINNGQNYNGGYEYDLKVLVNHSIKNKDLDTIAHVILSLKKEERKLVYNHIKEKVENKEANFSIKELNDTIFKLDSEIKEDYKNNNIKNDNKKDNDSNQNLISSTENDDLDNNDNDYKIDTIKDHLKFDYFEKKDKYHNMINVHSIKNKDLDTIAHAILSLKKEERKLVYNHIKEKVENKEANFSIKELNDTIFKLDSEIKEDYKNNNIKNDNKKDNDSNQNLINSIENDDLDNNDNDYKIDTIKDYLKFDYFEKKTSIINMINASDYFDIYIKDNKIEKNEEKNDKAEEDNENDNKVKNIEGILNKDPYLLNEPSEEKESSEKLQNIAKDISENFYEGFSIDI